MSYDKTLGMKKGKANKKGLGDKTQASGKPAYHTSKRQVNPISKIKYVKDIGLIATAFNGTIKFFDPFNFYQIWRNDNKMRAEN